MLQHRMTDAVQVLDAYRRGLYCHMVAEEAFLFPIYLIRHGEVPGGTMELFDAEHHKLEEWVENLLQMTLALGPTPSLPALLHLLEQEFRFKHLMEHHSRREENLLYPALDRVLSETERAEVIAYIAQFAPVISEAPPATPTPA
ncbi:MAG: hemerythrin domain-containing protein [Candidatus Xenobia bacterium]